MYVICIVGRDEINICYKYFVQVKLHLLVFLIITFAVPTYLILYANGIDKEKYGRLHSLKDCVYTGIG